MKKNVLLLLTLLSCSLSYAQTWIGNSHIVFNGTWYKGTNNSSSHPSFHGANLTTTKDIAINGEVQVYPKTNYWPELWYKLDSESSKMAIYLDTRKSDSGNNSVHQAASAGTISINGLTVGTHTIQIWFAVPTKSGASYPNDYIFDNNSSGNSGKNYVATFTVALPASPSAVAVSGSALSWKKNTESSNVMVVKVSDTAWNPTRGNSYAIGTNGVVYKGSETTCTLFESGIYKVYSVNNDKYYSNGVTIAYFDESSNIDNSNLSGTINNTYFKYEPKGDVWDFISLPFEVSNVKWADGTALTLGTDYWIANYNGEARATTGFGWEYNNLSNLKGGYAIWVDTEAADAPDSDAIVIRAKKPANWSDIYVYMWITGENGSFYQMAHQSGDWYQYAFNGFSTINILFASNTDFSNQTADIKDIKESKCFSVSSGNYTEEPCPVQEKSYLIFEGAGNNITNPNTVTAEYHSGAQAIDNGWVLLGSPLYAPAKFSASNEQKCYIWNGADYDIEVDDVVSIPPFTSFFVKMFDGSHNSLAFSSANLAPAANQTVSEKLTIRLNDNYKTVIRFNDAALMDYDNLYDAPYMPSLIENAPQIYTFKSNYKLGINTVSGTTDIHLGVHTPNTGEYTFSWDNQLFGCHVYLIDKLEEKTIDMSLESSYTFTTHSTGNIDDRFTVGVLRITTGLPQLEGNVKIYSDNHAIAIDGLKEPTAVSIYDLTGRMIVNRIASDSFRVKLQQGVYVVSVGEKRVKIINN